MKRLILMILACTVSSIVCAQMDRLLKDPESVDVIKKEQEKIPDWKVLKNEVYVGFPYPDKINDAYLTTELEVNRARLSVNGNMLTAVSMYRIIDYYRLFAQGIKGVNLQENDALSQMKSGLGCNEKSTEIIQESVNVIANTEKLAHTATDMAKTLGLQYDRSKDSSPQLKQELQQLSIEKKRKSAICDSLFDEASQGSDLTQQLDRELKSIIFERTATPDGISLSKEEEEKIRKTKKELSRAWYQKNYIDDGGRGLLAIEKATAYLIDEYLPIAEKQILVRSRVEGFNPAMPLQELYLESIQLLLSSRYFMLNQMLTCCS